MIASQWLRHFIWTTIVRLMVDTVGFSMTLKNGGHGDYLSVVTSLYMYNNCKTCGRHCWLLYIAPKNGGPGDCLSVVESLYMYNCKTNG